MKNGAKSAGLNMIHFIQNMLVSALTPANLAGDASPAWTMKRGIANDATQNLCAISMKKRASVPVRVQQLIGERRADTYALHVRDEHEFYANGILVQNSYDAFRYGLMEAAKTVTIVHSVPY